MLDRGCARCSVSSAVGMKKRFSVEQRNQDENINDFGEFGVMR
jgi:hypothetical protein